MVVYAFDAISGLYAYFEPVPGGLDSIRMNICPRNNKLDRMINLTMLVIAYLIQTGVTSPHVGIYY